MTAWNRPPAQGSAIVTTWAGLRRRSRRPRITIRLGASLLLIALAVLVLALRTNPSRANAAVPVTGDGTRRSVTLRENTQYGLFSDDHNLSCEVTAPSGEALTLSDTTGYSARTSRQVLGFRSARAGTYTVSCTGTGEITVDIADISPEFSRATLLYTCALTTGALGGLLVLGGPVLGRPRGGVVPGGSVGVGRTGGGGRPGRGRPVGGGGGPVGTRGRPVRTRGPGVQVGLGVLPQLVADPVEGGLHRVGEGRVQGPALPGAGLPGIGLPGHLDSSSSSTISASTMPSSSPAPEAGASDGAPEAAEAAWACSWA